VYRIAVIQLYPKVRKALFLLVISSAFFIRVHVIADPKYCLFKSQISGLFALSEPFCYVFPGNVAQGGLLSDSIRSIITFYVQNFSNTLS
jgi:hypothetical protein